MSMIKTNKLTKRYGKSRGIEDVTIGVGEGEIYGFIGPNGAGKSTFIRTILNFIYPTSGSGSVLARDIVKESLEIKRHVGYVPSEVNYYDDISVAKLLEYVRSYHPTFPKGEVESLADYLNLDMNKKIEELSHGNKKKVAIIQALIGSPKLLILDEPTNGLDPLIQQKLFKVLRDEKSKGNTVFLSSHQLSEVENLCDRVAIIKEGLIVDVIDVSTSKKELGLLVELCGNITDDDIAKIPLEVVSKIEDEYLLYFTGQVDELIKWASRYSFSKFTVKDQSLEDIFMKYYGEGEGETDESI